MSDNKLRTRVPLGEGGGIDIEANGIKALFMLSGFFGDIPKLCGNCNGGDLILHGYKNKGYDFYNVKCRDCNHTLKFGQKKEDGSLFLAKDTPWEPPYSRGEGQQQSGQRRDDGGNEDDIPF